jgi:hypothetical protein
MKRIASKNQKEKKKHNNNNQRKRSKSREPEEKGTAARQTAEVLKKSARELSPYYSCTQKVKNIK